MCVPFRVISVPLFVLSIPLFLSYRHMLVVFGGLKGLEACLENDQSLHMEDVSLLFQHYLNTCPGQGSRTIRTEVCVTGPLIMIELRPYPLQGNELESHHKSVVLITMSSISAWVAVILRSLANRFALVCILLVESITELCLCYVIIIIPVYCAIIRAVSASSM